jgi:hypothetical protein
MKTNPWWKYWDSLYLQTESGFSFPFLVCGRVTSFCLIAIHNRFSGTEKATRATGKW